MNDTRVEWLTIAGDLSAWEAIGLTTTDDGLGGRLVPLVGTSLRVVPAGDGVDAETGIVSWAVSGPSAEPRDPIDGLVTEVVDPLPSRFAEHASGAIGLDHVVVTTDDLERTSDAVAAATGHPRKRIRDLGRIRQGFHRMGPGGLIVEIVERADAPAGPASFWGVVLDVEDLDAVYADLGPDLVSEPKDAVQPGRRIATVRTDAGLGTAVALMSADR